MQSNTIWPKFVRSHVKQGSLTQIKPHLTLSWLMKRNWTSSTNVKRNSNVIKENPRWRLLTHLSPSNSNLFYRTLSHHSYSRRKPEQVIQRRRTYFNVIQHKHNVYPVSIGRRRLYPWLSLFKLTECWNVGHTPTSPSHPSHVSQISTGAKTLSNLCALQCTFWRRYKLCAFWRRQSFCSFDVASICVRLDVAFDVGENTRISEMDVAPTLREKETPLDLDVGVHLRQKVSHERWPRILFWVHGHRFPDVNDNACTTCTFVSRENVIHGRDTKRAFCDRITSRL